MRELIIFNHEQTADMLINVCAEHQAAAKRFLYFLRDQNAYAKNTLLAFQRAIKSWVFWCKDNGVLWFPISEEHARLYLLSRHDLGIASSSIQIDYAMLNMLLKQCGLSPLSDSQTISLAMRKIKREAVIDKGERTGQAIPLLWNDLKVLDVLLLRNHRSVDLRNRAFLFLAYNTLLRMSEMSRIRVRDIEFMGNHVTLQVSHTKTTATAAGISKHLAKCTTSVIHDWLDVSGLAEYPDSVLFPPVHRSGTVRITSTPLSAPAIEKIFSDAWVLMNKANAPVNKGRYATWTGHSARVGAAIDMANSKVSMVEIMREGTWRKPETLMRYLRSTDTETSVNSRLMDT